jgi:hypothetical protein
LKGTTTKLLKRMLHVPMLVVLMAGTLAFGLARSAPVAGQATPDAQAKIANAMSAAPAAIADNATILDYELDADGRLVVLRDGSNGWTCQPDGPGTPSNDPWCFDQTWSDWLGAFVAGEEPDTTVVGLAYLLQGGTDPVATEPAAGEDWVASPPHIMIIVPGDLDQSVFSTDHDSAGPFIMWAGTPYEHLMMPVAEPMHQE